jgi:hypothetical protein
VAGHVDHLWPYLESRDDLLELRFRVRPSREPLRDRHRGETGHLARRELVGRYTGQPAGDDILGRRHEVSDDVADPSRPGRREPGIELCPAKAHDESGYSLPYRPV